MGIFIHPLFLALNAILAVWILFEFHRRYTGKHPLAFATGLILFPLVPIVPWILAYCIVSGYTQFADKKRRRLNRIAILFSGLLFFGVVFLILGFAVVAGSIWISKDGEWMIWLILALISCVSLACFGSAIATGVKCSAALKNAEQGVTPNA